MFRLNIRYLTAIVCSAAMTCGFPPVFGGPADRLQSDPGPQMAVQSSDIRGVVLRSDGETPISSLPIRVWDAVRERVIFDTSTDDQGLFRIPKLGESRFFVIVGELRIDLQMFKNAGIHQQRHDIVIVLPRKIAVGTVAPIPAMLILPVLPPPEPNVVSP